MRRGERRGPGGAQGKGALEEQLPPPEQPSGGADRDTTALRRSTESEVYDDGTNTFFWRCCRKRMLRRAGALCPCAEVWEVLVSLKFRSSGMELPPRPAPFGRTGESGTRRHCSHPRSDSVHTGCSATSSSHRHVVTTCSFLVGAAGLLLPEDKPI